jgi:hypothetical protein
MSMVLKRIGILAICLAVIAGSTLAFLSASISIESMQHANEKHEGAIGVRGRLRNGLCQQREIWFKAASGRVLLLCQLEETPSRWGGWIVYATSNRGREFLPEMQEATVFIADESYWRRVIKEDGYVRGFLYPRVVDHVTDSLGIP